MHVVIPAYRPSAELLRLVTDLRRSCPSGDVLVVDDGSGSEYDEVFARAARSGATVVRTSVNHGKGAALKTAFRHLAAIRAHGAVVTADADGQHAVADILAVGGGVDLDPAAPAHLVLGERHFDTATPARSRIGNTATRLLFRLGTGIDLHDTQTGLRAFPSRLLPWLAELPGERYEFELVQLLRASRAGVELRSVPVSTIYEDGNSSSHFRPIIDSTRIYAPLLLFLASSFGAFVLDVVGLLVLDAVTGSLLVSVVGARLASASTNFVVNRHVVFGGSATWAAAARRYAALAATLLVANYLILDALVSAGLPLLPAKLLTEAVLLAVSYAVQARYVYSPPGPRQPPAAPSPARPLGFRPPRALL